MKANVDSLILNCLLAIDLDLHSFQKKVQNFEKVYGYRIYLNNSPCFNNSPSPGLDVKNGDFLDDFWKI